MDHIIEDQHGTSGVRKDKVSKIIESGLNDLGKEALVR